MIIVGIETSGLTGSVALHRDDECLEMRWLDQVGRRHAQSLILELNELLKGHHLSPRQVDAIAVSHGPGSFTGLRVGLVCAKTFAYATRCQFVAVDTMVAVAMNCPADVSDLWVVEDAQRGDFFAGYFARIQGNGWHRTTEIQVVDSEAWLPQRNPTETIVGRGLLRADVTTTSARCLTSEEWIRPRASMIAAEGHRLLLQQSSSKQSSSNSPQLNFSPSTRNPTSLHHDPFDFWKAVPVYIRPSAAEEQRERRDLQTP
jgi:tRNA threonylcarbamoyladenosine biosynthesis protein TsaB